MAAIAGALSFAVNVTGLRDMVFDASRDLLYITTADGDLERYDVAARTLLTPFDVGTALNAADITADGSALYVAEGTRSATQGFVRKVDLSDGSVTNIGYDLDFGEGGAFDIAIGSGGKALVTTVYEGSGWTPLRALDLASDTLSIVTPNPGSAFNELTGGMVERSADRDLLLLTEGNISSGPLFTYDAVSGTFPAHDQTGTFVGGPSAVNRDGSLLALRINNAVAVLDPGLAAVENIGISAQGIAFDPVRDILYVTDPSADELIAFDTSTFDELYRLNVGADLANPSFFNLGSMTVSDDGKYAFVATATGLQMVQLADVGTAGGDTIVGSSGSDFFVALDGADQLRGGGGDDLLVGDGDADSLYGDSGRDVIEGGEGADRIFGGDGADIAHGGPGDDYLQGGLRNDVLFGDDGHDIIAGGTGSDRLFGGLGNDRLVDESGNDSLVGGMGDDVMTGGSGAIFEGAQGRDTFRTKSFDFYSIDGGTGTDRVVLLGGGLDIDLQLFDDSRIRGVESINIRGSGANELTLALNDVLALSDTTDLLIVEGGSDDVLHLAGSWELDEIPYYELYTLGSASVLVNTATAVDITL